MYTVLLFIFSGNDTTRAFRESLAGHHLCKNCDEARLPKKGRLATHVRSGEQKHVGCRRCFIGNASRCDAKRGVVRNILAALIRLRETGVSRILEADERWGGGPLVELRPRESRLGRHLGKRQNGIQVGQASDGTGPKLPVLVKLGEQSPHLAGTMVQEREPRALRLEYTRMQRTKIAKQRNAVAFGCIKYGRRRHSRDSVGHTLDSVQATGAPGLSGHR